MEWTSDRNRSCGLTLRGFFAVVSIATFVGCGNKDVAQDQVAQKQRFLREEGAREAERGKAEKLRAREEYRARQTLSAADLHNMYPELLADYPHVRRIVFDHEIDDFPEEVSLDFTHVKVTNVHIPPLQEERNTTPQIKFHVTNTSDVPMYLSTDLFTHDSTEYREFLETRITHLKRIKDPASLQRKDYPNEFATFSCGLPTKKVGDGSCPVHS